MPPLGFFDQRRYFRTEVNPMKKIIVIAATTIALAIAAFGQAAPAPPTTHLKVGDMAPDFKLTDTTGKEVKLSDYRGKKNVVLAFYVLAFTGG
jgi:cytochrome oxidase Cu insertion factor (SCO1/SenC/PrrC family)